jgi:TPR repeat protein
LETDLKEAVRYWETSTDQGNSDAQFYCGLCLFKGEGVPRDWTRAARFWRILLSGDQGNIAGLWCYALCLEEGLGVPQNPDQVIECRKVARNFGNQHQKEGLFKNDQSIVT